MLKKKKNNKGFTLIELLVVIAIIGILAVVAVPSLFKNINKAKAADVVSYVSAVRTEAVSEYADTQNKTVTDQQLSSIVGDVKDKPEGVTVTAITFTDDGCVVNITGPSDLNTMVTEKLGSHVVYTNASK